MTYAYPPIVESATSTRATNTSSGLRMEVSPAEVTGRAAEFRVTFLNNMPWPAIITPAVRVGTRGVRIRLNQNGPVVVPAHGIGTVRACVAPTMWARRGRIQGYVIEFRGRQSGIEEDATAPQLICQTHFTYMPRKAPRRWQLRQRPVLALLSALIILLLVVLVWGRSTITQASKRAATPRAANASGVLAGRLKQAQAPAIAALVRGLSITSSQSDILLNPLMMSFSSQNVHTTSNVRTIHLVNVSPTPFIIITVGISGADRGDFAVGTDCAGKVISAYGGCTVRVRFTPLAPGLRRVRLVIVTARAEESWAVSLSGEGR